MRKVGLLASGVGLAVCAMACTAILGDFEVGGPGDAGDAGDAGSSDGPSGDTAPDAPIPLKPMNCSLDQQRTTFGFTSGSVTIDGGDRISIYQMPGNKYRGIIQHYDTLYYADFQDGQTNVTLQPFGAGGRIVNSSRYVDPAGSGTIFLVYDQTSAALSTIDFPDSVTLPVAGPTVAKNLPAPFTGTSYNGSIAVLSSQAQDYVVVVQSTQDGSSYVVQAGHSVNGNPAPSLVSLITTSGQDGIPQYPVAHDPGNVYILLSPPGNPPSGSATMWTLSRPGFSLSTSSPRKLQSATSGIYVPAAMGMSQNGVDISFIEADLNNPNQTPLLHSGVIPPPALPTFDPAQVPSSPVALGSVPFNKGVFHWVTFSGEDELVGAGRPIQDGLPGMNLVWYDSLGRQRALIAGSNGGANFPTTMINTVDFTFNGQPTAIVASLEVMWSEGQAQNQVNPPIYAARASCIAAQ